VFVEETSKVLRRVPMFRDLSEEEMEGLSRITIERTYRKKTVIFHEGQEKEAVFFIKDGMVKTFKTDENGHEHIVSFLKTGDMFPHTGLFHQDPYPATAESIVDTILLAMPVKPFEQLLMSTPVIAVKIMRAMSDKIRELQEKLQELTGHDVQDRGQSFLLKLSEHYGKVKNGEVHIEIPMTHQDIASTIGTTRETVNRLLNQLRKEGIVDTDRSGFVIHDIEALRNWKAK
jgi:CRP/FNR family transcriptional regulator, cyclic AMP receptor protein